MKFPAYFFLIVLVSCFLPVGGLNKTSGASLETANRLLKNKPVRFIENKGQFKDMNGQVMHDVLFKATAAGVDLYVTNRGLTYIIYKTTEVKDVKRFFSFKKQKDERIKVEYERIDMEFKNAAIKAENIVKTKSSDSEHIYYSPGNSSPIRNVYGYEKIVIKDLYPGIDWILYNTRKNGFKYDFVVHAGSDISKLIMEYRTPKAVTLDKSITAVTSLGSICDEQPVSYFADNNEPLKSEFIRLSEHKTEGRYITQFRIGAYAPRLDQRDFIIDPQLTWSTFLGDGNIEGTQSADTDHHGNLFACGYSSSLAFPLLNSGTYFLTSGWGLILKFSPQGALLWSTYFTGVGAYNNSLTCDKNGNLFVCGFVPVGQLPTQNNNSYFQGVSGGQTDAFIAKFDNAGNLLWSTYYGGTGDESARCIYDDPAGNIFVSGPTTSGNFPTLNSGTYYQGPLPANNLKGFILKFDNNGNRLWATCYERMHGEALTCDSDGNVYITATAFPGMNTLSPGTQSYYQPLIGGSKDACLLKFDNSGNLKWATYYGGSAVETGHAIVCDRNKNVFITGLTLSNDLPTLNAGTFFQGTLASSVTTLADAFIAKFDSSGIRQWATYYGSSGNETLIYSNDNIETDSCGNVFLAFETNGNFSTQVSCDGGYQDNNFDIHPNNAYAKDIFLSMFSNNGNRLWASYFAGQGDDFRCALAMDRKRRLYLTGEWSFNGVGTAVNYPITNSGPGSYMDSTANGGDDMCFNRLDFSGGPVEFSYQSPVCINTGSTSPTIPSGAGQPGFSSAPGLSVDPGTGVVYPVHSLPGTYTITHLGAGCLCGNSAATNATITIAQLPTLTITPSMTICAGNSVAISVSGAKTYTWSTASQSGSLLVSPPASKTYTVSGKDAAGCTSTAAVVVYVEKCTGIQEIQIAGINISVYPNPNNGSFMVTGNKPVDLQLTNELGQVIRKIILNEAHQKISVTGLAPGVYVISGARERSAKYKVIVQ